MRVEELHAWDVTPDEARAIQRDLRHRPRLVDVVSPSELRYVAGVDNGYASSVAETIAYAAVVVLRFPELEVIETRFAALPVTFPYVPGLLSFREAPAMIAALRSVETDPDVVLFDAQGYAHPRRLGAASHLGLLVDRPSIGCAKSRLVGSYDEPGPERGSSSPLVHRGEVVGAALRTREGHAPLFVSPGHLVTVETATAIVMACCRERYFMPEPTRLADKLGREWKRQQMATLPR
jgi:deoxyribonuclease V